MKLSPADQELIRTRPQKTRLYLSIFTPRVVMQCRINNPTAARNNRIIPYDTVSLGSFDAVESGMTLLIGTTPGTGDVGRIRIRSADATQFIVSENSNIDWQDNLYLTVLRYWELWPVYPRIINDPNNAENVIFYKDYDIPYSNQNLILGTFPCAGPHRAAFTGDQIWYSSTGTYNLRGDSLSYNWAFEGGVPTGSTSPDPGYVTYNTPGHYVTRLVISGSGGGIDTTYRYVSIYNRPGEGNTPPILKWSMGDLSGSRSEGGYRLPLKIFETVQVDDNSVVVLFAEDWYGETKKSLGGNYPNSANIVFVGYVEKDSIRYDYKQSSVEFDVLSLTGIMKQTDAFSVSVKSVLSPSVWYEVYDLNLRRAIYHYLKWHTTVLSISDFEFKGDDRPIQYFDADRTSIFDAIDNLMRNTLIGSVVSDRQGKIWAEVDAQAYTNPTGSFPSVMSISKRDWMNEPVIEERLGNEISYLEYGGIAYSGAGVGTFVPLMASAPGNAPSFRGKPETLEGLALLDQIQLNQLVGNVFANKNAKYPSISLDITENLRSSDIAPQETYGIHISPEDTARNIHLDILGTPSDVSWKYDPIRGVLVPSIMFNNLVSGVNGQTLPIPSIPPEPPFPPFPPPPSIPPFPQFPLPSIYTKKLVILTETKGIFYTENANAESIQWLPWNGGIPSGSMSSIIHLEVSTTSGRGYIRIGQDTIMSSPGFGQDWVTVLDRATVAAYYGSTLDQARISSMGINRIADDEVVVIAGWQQGQNNFANLWKGSSSGLTARVSLEPGGWFNQSNGTIVYGDNKWLCSDAGTGFGATLQANRECSSYLYKTEINSDALMLTRGGADSKVAYARSYAFTSSTIFKTINNGQSFTNIPFNLYNDGNFSFDALGSSPDGIMLLAGRDVTDGAGLLRSGDGGTTWGATVVLAGVSAVWGLGDNYQFVIAEIAQILYTPDFADSFVNLTGNLQTWIGPFEKIRAIRSL